VLLKFEAVDTMNDAMPLAGHDVVIPESDVFEIKDEDVFYEFDLVGCSVELAGGEVVGQVGSILHTGAGELLSVIRAPIGCARSIEGRRKHGVAIATLLGYKRMRFDIVTIFPFFPVLSSTESSGALRTLGSSTSTFTTPIMDV
jgi:hypothetical protein